jgi:hypothetical protein
MKRLKHPSSGKNSNTDPLTCGPLGDWLINMPHKVDNDIFGHCGQNVRVHIWERIGNEVSKPVVMTIGRIPGLYETRWTIR